VVNNDNDNYNDDDDDDDKVMLNVWKRTLYRNAFSPFVFRS